MRSDGGEVEVEIFIGRRRVTRSKFHFLNQETLSIYLSAFSSLPTASFLSHPPRREEEVMDLDWLLVEKPEEVRDLRMASSARRCCPARR